MMNEHEPHMWVTVIQIGTKACTIAHQGRNHFVTNPANVTLQVMPGSDTGLQPSFPSSLLISRNGSLSAFGFSAVNKYKDMKDGIFFENIIESLYRSEEFSEETLIKDSKGITHNALDVFSKFLKAVFQYIKDNFKIKGIPVFNLEDDIQWVLAFPSVRADKAVSFFIKGWEKIGLPEGMSTVTYPNAVLNYCLYLPPEQYNGTSFDTLPTGERVMVIGFEDEIDSFNVYEKLENQSFKQVVNHLSGTGSIGAITDAFDSFFSDLFGSWIWEVAKQVDKPILSKVVLYCNRFFISKIESENKKINIQIEGYVNLSKTCEEHINMTLAQSVEQSEYATKIKLVNDILKIEQNLIRSLFDTNFKKVIHNIKYALARSEGKKVNTIILAGSIANSPLLKCAVITEFPNKQIFDIEQAEDTALKGAALFGHAPIVVSSIFCGAQVMVPR